MVDDHRIWTLGRLVLKRGRGLDPAGWVMLFCVASFVGAAPCREARLETVQIENLAAAGCIASTHSFFRVMYAVNGGAVHSMSIEISDTTFISTWSSGPALSRI
jgi:hypothetical protein